MNKIRTLGKSLLLAAVIGVMGASMTACNTISGIGKDISAIGKGVSKGADNTKKTIE